MNMSGYNVRYIHKVVKECDGVCDGGFDGFGMGSVDIIGGPDRWDNIIGIGYSTPKRKGKKRFKKKSLKRK